jgi:quinol monooxygenase YgiN
LHGKNDIKDGIPVNSRPDALELTCTSQPPGSHACEPKAGKEIIMLKLALFVRLEAKPGKEKEVIEFLKTGLALANQEATTAMWFALRLGPSTFGVFDAFADEAGRQTHLNGPIAKALMTHAPDLLAAPPSIERVEVLCAKLPSADALQVK